MKKLFSLLISIVFISIVFAQPPEKISYQAVFRDASNTLVTNHAVGMRISILQGSAIGTTVYTEIQTPTTNANGLVSIEIGGGTGFDAIDWGNGLYFIKTETDPTGGTNYTITGTSQILSVPFALYAKTAETADYDNLTNKPLFATVATSGNYSDLTGLPTLFDGTWTSLTNKPTTITGFGITDAMSTSHAANAITITNIGNWNTAYGWGNHANAGYLTYETDTMLWKKNGSDIYFNKGNVGIGTTTPGAKLDVNGNVQIAPGGGLILTNTGVSGTLSQGVAGLFIRASGSVTDLSMDMATSSGISPAGRLFLSATGNVGIGTTTPGAKLDINGNVQIAPGSGLILTNTGVSGTLSQGMAGLFIRASGSTSNLGMDLATSSGVSPAGRLFLSATGNVGIGTKEPLTRLNLKGSGEGVEVRGTDSEDNEIIYQVAHASGHGGFISLRDNNGNETILLRGWNSQPTIFNSGNVGIGTTNPEAMLHVSGSPYPNIIVENKSKSGEAYFRVKNTGGYMGDFMLSGTADLFFGGPNSLNIINNTAAPITFYNNGQERMRVDSNGNIGIGTTTPGAKLDVNGNVQIAPGGGLILTNTGVSGTLSQGVDGLFIRASGSTSDLGVDMATSSGISPAGRLFLSATGNVGIGTTDPSTKLHVKCGDGYFESIGKGVILRSPDGHCFRVTVDNSGNLVTSAIACP